MSSFGIFQLREANATLHFDKFGKLLKIKKELYATVDNFA